ncbi:MAG: glutamate synthase subunit beta [Candidatus Omnitrophica bacterium]|nr:glutamate synthase subunit beta [Candidatus Omnitrophota bacterium]MDD5429864.1 glutamate synthase subunit beta [Candidatus Omnitrophota bacterium]
MKGLKNFLTTKRSKSAFRPSAQRLKDYKDVVIPRNEPESIEQAGRCMDCGTPFCHWACPLANYIPEWNDLAADGHWEEAYRLLEASNEFPEITSRVCPSLCEYSCVLGINDEAVTIRENEYSVIEKAFSMGIVKPRRPYSRNGKCVAVIGSGPAGLSTAAYLNRLGYKVVVFERDEKVGGILRFGIPDFKLEKWTLDRRIKIWEEEGIIFKTNVDVGRSYSAGSLLKEFDAVCLVIGSRRPRDLDIPGRNLKGIHFAMDFLSQNNRRLNGDNISEHGLIEVSGKRVVIVGGGDTGADCLGVALRQKAESVTQIEIMPQPPESRPPESPWPKYPLLLKETSSHKEGGKRLWSVLTKEFAGCGKVEKLSCVKVSLSKNSNGRICMEEIKASEFVIDADAVIIAAGFLGPEPDGILKALGIKLDSRGNIKTDSKYMTSHKGVFAAGDARRGQSLVVWALAEGRQAARGIDLYLRKKAD